MIFFLDLPTKIVDELPSMNLEKKIEKKLSVLPSKKIDLEKEKLRISLFGEGLIFSLIII